MTDQHNKNTTHSPLDWVLNFVVIAVFIFVIFQINDGGDIATNGLLLAVAICLKAVFLFFEAIRTIDIVNLVVILVIVSGSLMTLWGAMVKISPELKLALTHLGSALLGMGIGALVPKGVSSRRVTSSNGAQNDT